MSVNPSSPQPASGLSSLAELDRQWQLLHELAGRVITLARKAPADPREQPIPPELLGFPRALAARNGARRQLAEEGLADLVAILEPGLAALLHARESGADVAAPAWALWKEFVSARAALVALANKREA